MERAVFLMTVVRHFDHAGTGPFALNRVRRHLCGAFLSVTVSLAGISGAADLVVAQEAEPFRLVTQNGFGRMIFSFSQLPGYNVKATDSVLVVSFDRKVDLKQALQDLKDQDFVVAGRLDPDGKAVRFALGRTLKVNAIEAGEQLFVDLLPATWTGAPPALPAKVIAELNRRAKIVEKESRKEALIKEARDRNRRVHVRIGEHQTFTRIAFQWAERPNARVTRAGNKIHVTFDEIATPVMGRLLTDPPKFVNSAESHVGEEGLTVTLNIEPQTDVRGFREDKSYIVDISSSAQDQSLTGLIKTIVGEKTAPSEPARDQSIELKSDRSKNLAETHEADPSAPVAGSTPSRTDALKTTVEMANAEPAPIGVQDLPPADAKPELDPNRDIAAALSDEQMDVGVPTIVVRERPLDRNGSAPLPDHKVASLSSNRNDATTAISEQSSRLPDDSAAKEPISRSDQPAKKNSTIEPAASSDAEPLKAGDDHSDYSRKSDITFAFDEPVAAAAFVRSDALWLVFDTDEPVDWGPLTNKGAAYLGKPATFDADGVRIARLPLSTNLRLIAKPEGTSWTISLRSNGDGEAKPIKLKRGKRQDGLLKVSTRVPGANKVHFLKDPVVGDTITVVTVHPDFPARSKAQKFVEFDAIDAAQGLVIKPYADDLAVRLSEKEIIITRRSGLTLSPPSDATGLGSDSSKRSTAIRGLVDFRRWAGDTDKPFSDYVGELEYGISTLPGFQAVGLRLELAKFYLSNQLGPEAYGQLHLIRENDPDVEGKPIFHAMLAIAKILMHRPTSAGKDLSYFGVQDDASMMPWRAEMNRQLRHWREALVDYIRSEDEISQYPEELRNRFRLNAARTAIEVEDWQTADFQLRSLPDKRLGPTKEAAATLLRGRLLQGLGRTAEALDAYGLAIASTDRKAEAEATFHHTGLALEMGTITPDEAVHRLESATVMWRGDDLELQVLRELAKMHAMQHQYRRAMGLMKTAVVNFPGNPIARSIHDDMAALFRSLYLDGRAEKMSPIKALGLYYDFRELTPVGRLGDEMIRKLADRLVAVDLLDKAAEVLTHQVEKRLHGSARAQVAAKLAVVHLMDHKPKMALEVLRKSRQAMLPQSLKSKRILLEATALSEIGLPQQAVDLLTGLDGVEFERARAQAYWKNESWQKSGEAFERVLTATAGKDKPLSKTTRVEVMKGAISYALAEDAFGLSRFRDQFLERMNRTNLASSFDVVTQPSDHAGIEFRNLAKEIASVDSLETFLEDFRKSLEEEVASDAGKTAAAN